MNLGGCNEESTTTVMKNGWVNLIILKSLFLVYIFTKNGPNYINFNNKRRLPFKNKTCRQAITQIKIFNDDAST